MTSQSNGDTTTDTTAPGSSSTANKNSSILSVLQQLQSPDGYYRYLNITKCPQSTTPNSFLTPQSSTPTDPSPKTDPDANGPDRDRIERNFRKLSLRHHPDRPGGDAETFRSLKRAKLVLMDDKLRKEYDLLGLDLEEDQESEDHQEEDGEEEGKGQGDTVISHMANATIAAILKFARNTVCMGFISAVFARYKYLLYPCMLFLLFIAYRITRAHLDKPPKPTKGDILSPIIIAIAMYIMHSARNQADLDGTDYWSWKFYLAEITFMTLFILNSLTVDKTIPVRPSIAASAGYTVLAAIACTWIRGRLWRYGIIVVLELILALLAGVIFPTMEVVLEEIMREKLKKIGEKVRAYAKILEEEVGSCKRCREMKIGGTAGRRGDSEERADALKKRHGGGSSSGGID